MRQFERIKLLSEKGWSPWLARTHRKNLNNLGNDHVCGHHCTTGKEYASQPYAGSLKFMFILCQLWHSSRGSVTVQGLANILISYGQLLLVSLLLPVCSTRTLMVYRRKRSFYSSDVTSMGTSLNLRLRPPLSTI